MLFTEFGHYAERKLEDKMPFYSSWCSSPLKKRYLGEGYYVPMRGNCVARALLVLALSQNVDDATSFLDLTMSNKGKIIHAKAGLALPGSDSAMLIDTGATGALLGFGTTIIKYICLRDLRTPGIIRNGMSHIILNPESVEPRKLGIRTSMLWPEMSRKILELA